MQYWELIYNHLIAPELAESILEKALSYALAAVSVLKKDGATWVLLGKIYMHLKQYNLAEEAFSNAVLFNISPAQVLPYLAEITFKTHDYIALQNYLSTSDTLLDIAQIAPVKIFWDEN